MEVKTHLQLVDSNPRITWKTLKHGHEKLQTTTPMSDEEHHADQVKDPHKHRRHIQELPNNKTT